MEIILIALTVIGPLFMGIGWLLLFSMTLNSESNRETRTKTPPSLTEWPKWTIQFLSLARLYSSIMTLGISFFIEIFSNSESLTYDSKRVIGAGFALFLIGLTAFLIAYFLV